MLLKPTTILLVTYLGISLVGQTTSYVLPGDTLTTARQAKDTEIPKFLRNLTLTTQSDDYCGGYNVWIEIEVDGKTCATKEIPGFDRGDTLLWYGKYLSSCRDFEFGEDLELIIFKVKSNSNNKYCPRYLHAFVEGGITFKSDQMAHESGDWYQNSKTNYRDHIARRTSGTFELPKSAIKTPGQGEKFDKKEKEIKTLLQLYKGSQSLDKFLKGLVPITHNSIFNPSDITEKSCKQFDLLLDDWVKNVDIVYKENKENPPNKSTLSLIELIDFKWKLERMIDVESDEYQEWTTTVRSTAYGTATGVTVGMVIADVFGCLGICSAAVTSSTWAATLATVETTIATATSELEGLDALANGLTGKMMDHYCA